MIKEGNAGDFEERVTFGCIEAAFGRHSGLTYINNYNKLILILASPFPSHWLGLMKVVDLYGDRDVVGLYSTYCISYFENILNVRYGYHCLLTQWPPLPGLIRHRSCQEGSLCCWTRHQFLSHPRS